MGKEPATASLPPVLSFFDAANSSSRLSVTYDRSPRFPSLNLKSRIKAKFSTKRPGSNNNYKRNVVLSEYAPGVVPSTAATPVLPILRPRFPALSPFVPNLTLHSLTRPRNRTRIVINYPRIPQPIDNSKNSNKKRVKTVFATAAPVIVPSQLINVTLLEGSNAGEGVIPVNLSAHLRLDNTHQQQRVVLNSIQEIINSMKSEQQGSEVKKNVTGNEGREQKKKKKTSVAGVVVKPVIVHAKAANSAVNTTENFKVFKYRFFEKLKQHQNLLKSKQSNSTKLLQKRLDGNNTISTITPNNKSNSSLVTNGVAVIPQNVAKAESHNSPPALRSITPSAFNRTQRQALNGAKPMKLFGAFKLSSTTTFEPHQTTSSKDEDESKFMAHLKDYLSKLEHPTSTKPTGRHVSIRSPYAGMSRIDYGEVERILAYVNPYGRRISMPSTSEYSTLAESQTHENRNVRLQRSAYQGDWFNSSQNGSNPQRPDAAVDNWNQVASLNLSAQVGAERESWLNTLLAEFNNTKHDEQPSDSFRFISFPSANNSYSQEYTQLDKDEFRGSTSNAKAKINFKPSTVQNKIVEYGMRNQQRQQQKQPQSQPSRDLTFEWTATTKGGKQIEEMEAKQAEEAPASEIYPNYSEPPPSPPPIDAVGNLRHIAQSTINYDPRESQYNYYPRERFVGGESERDWVTFFQDLEGKMKRDQESRRVQLHFSDGQFRAAPHPALYPTMPSDYEDLLVPVPETIGHGVESFDGLTVEPSIMSSSLPLSQLPPPSLRFTPQTTQSKSPSRAMSLTVSPKINREKQMPLLSPLYEDTSMAPLEHFANNRERVTATFTGSGSARMRQPFGQPHVSSNKSHLKPRPAEPPSGLLYQAPIRPIIHTHYPQVEYGHRHLVSHLPPEVHFRPRYHLSRVLQYTEHDHHPPAYPLHTPYIFY